MTINAAAQADSSGAAADPLATLDLLHLAGGVHSAARAMVAVSGMADLVRDIRGSAGLDRIVQAALDSGASVICDCEMVRAGIEQTLLGASNPLVVTLNHPDVPALARTLGTTRSAAAVDLWGDSLGGAIVVIGNAPTALFRLFELLNQGAPRPAAILGIPVGFVGAAESKALLAQGAGGVPFLTVLGRRGGSAMASAAFNALAIRK